MDYFRNNLIHYDPNLKARTISTFTELENLQGNNIDMLYAFDTHSPVNALPSQYVNPIPKTSATHGFESYIGQYASA